MNHRGLELNRTSDHLATKWWRRQLAVLRAAQHRRSSYVLRQAQNVSFVLLLRALVPPLDRNFFALNIGGGDGVRHDPVYPLFHDANYGGVIVEPDIDAQQRLLSNAALWNSSGKVHLSRKPILPIEAHLHDFLEEFQVPDDPDVVKIDIDSYDGHLLDKMLQVGLQPKVVAVECNPDIPPPWQWRLEYDSLAVPDANGHLYGAGGASPAALYDLMVVRNNYSLVSIELWSDEWNVQEHNMWFVRNDFVGLKQGDTLVSWEGMVELYWGQVTIPSRVESIGPCIHLNRYTRCPIDSLWTLVSKWCPGYANLTDRDRSIFSALRCKDPMGEYLSHLSDYLVGDRDIGKGMRLCKGCRASFGVTPLLDLPDYAIGPTIFAEASRRIKEACP